MTVRERWYAYWHAKRAFERHNLQMINEVLTWGQAFERVDLNHPATKYIERAIDMAINPPMIYDPILQRIWKPEGPTLKAGSINRVIA